MDNKTPASPQPNEAPKPAPAPAMDVVAPPAPSRPTGDDDSKPHVPPPPEPDSPGMPHDKKLQALELPKTTPKPAGPKQPSSGVGMAIFGTVVIVLVLAAVAVYAYLQSKR